MAKEEIIETLADILRRADIEIAENEVENEYARKLVHILQKDLSQ